MTLDIKIKDFKLGDGIKLIKGDCLELMKDIPDNSVNLICVDLPFGTTECNWDKHIDSDKMWEQFNRVLSIDGNVALFASQPFVTKLINSNPKMFRYEIIWVKSRPTGFANANHRPMKKHENILIFTKSSTSTAGIVHAKYNPQGLIECERKIKRTSRGYQGERENSSDEYVSKHSNYPTSIWEFSSEGKTVHPTQKPVLLLEEIVKTFSNEGDVVLDCCMGSGSTGEACLKTNRNFIGIEQDDKYFEIAKKRIEDTYNSKSVSN